MRRKIRSRDAEAFHVAARKIDSSLAEIDRDILPEVGELQSAANQIRQMLPLGAAITKKIEHQPPYRIRRIARVAEQIVKSAETLELDVRAKRSHQIDKRPPSKTETPHPPRNALNTHKPAPPPP